MIGMFAFADVTDENNHSTLELEREKLNFTVSVQLLHYKDF